MTSHQNFALIETLRFIPNQGYRYLAEHMQRLKASSHTLGFHFQEHVLHAQLHALHTSIPRHCPSKVRITLNRTGQINITTVPIHEARQAYSQKRIIFSDQRTDAAHPLYRHKTTYRNLYQQEYAFFCQARDYYEVLFCNRQGLVTEGSRTNIFIRLPGDRVIYTPNVNLGVLPGVMRARLLNRLPQIQQAKFPQEQVYQAEKIWLTNSVRGVVRVFR